MKLILVSMIIVFTYASEFSAIEKACDNKVATACYEFAFLYETGVWVNKNVNKAKEYYIKSCDYGYDKACKELEQFKMKVD